MSESGENDVTNLLETHEAENPEIAVDTREQIENANDTDLKDSDNDENEDENEEGDEDQENEDAQEEGSEMEDDNNSASSEGSEEEIRASKKRRRKEKGRKNKRNRYDARRFMDEAASEGEDEDEGDLDEGHGYDHATTEDELRAQRRVDERNEMNWEFQNKTAVEIAEEIERRFEYSREKEKELRKRGGTELQTALGHQALLPSIKDPKIFMVKVKMGMEKLLVRSIMLKTMDVHKTVGIHKVKSVFCGPSSGYIYVEAMSEAFAKEILSGLKGIFMSKIEQVPIASMTSLLTVKLEKKPLRVGMFVRIRKGVLKGDLARIIQLKEGDSRAVIQAVPRIDYSEPLESEKDGIKLVSGEVVRPPQALFDPERAFATSDVHRNVRKSTYDWQGEHYQDGYLIKEVHSAHFIDSMNVKPTIQELQLFQHTRKERPDYYEEDEDNEEQLNISSFNEDLNQQLRELESVDLTKQNPFAPGDLVRVIKGELINLIGKITVVDMVKGIVKLLPMTNQALTDEISVEMNMITKYIETGAHVKVMAGRYTGHTGRVVGLSYAESDPLAVILTDGLNTEIQCGVSLLQLSSEVTAGLGNLQGYELYDLVLLNENEAGVIVHVGIETLKILTQLDNVKDVSPQEIRSKQNLLSQRTKGIDQQQSSFSVGDTLNVVGGPHAKLTGTVKHIYKGNVWLHNNTYLKNSGLFVVKSRFCVVAGAASQTTSAKWGAPPSASGRSSAQSTPASQASRTPSSVSTGFGRRDQLIGLTVRITKGKYKGLLAQIIQGDGKFYSMELLAKLKKIQLSKDHFVPAGDRTGNMEKQQDGFVQPAAYSVGSEIPSTPYLLSSQTPVHSFTGSETPHFNLGNETPSTNWGNQTPHYDGSAWKINSQEFDDPSNDSLLGATPRSEYSISTQSVDKSANQNEFIPNMVVLIKSGTYMGRLAVLLQVSNQSDKGTVQLRDGTGTLKGDAFEISLADVNAAQVPKGASVYILSGKNKGKLGKVKTVAGREVIVDVTGGSIESLRMNSVAWLNS